MTEENAGGFAIFIGNRYMIIRNKMEECFEMYSKNCDKNETLVEKKEIT